MSTSRVSTWRELRAILALPFVATVVVPALLAWRGDVEPGWGLPTAAAAIVVVAGALLVAFGLGLFVSTVRLFAAIGEGTLAPWDPPRRLVVAGPYRHLRHPMITGVAAVLAGETAVLGTPAMTIWLGAFVAANAIYLPLIEEPRLVARFGADYERYMRHVPRWVPRMRPWTPPQ
jgi:protein-S-isoprenylcysteine O-methyltransferase Ste14